MTGRQPAERLTAEAVALTRSDIEAMTPRITCELIELIADARTQRERITSINMRDDVVKAWREQCGLSAERMLWSVFSVFGEPDPRAHEGSFVCHFMGHPVSNSGPDGERITTTRVKRTAI